MSNAPILSVENIMAAGLKRISSIAAKHGINSPEVLAACERWGGILDDINHPDTTCRNCGHPVTYIPSIERYIHADRYWDPTDKKKQSATWCVTHAGATAKPLDQVHTEKELAKVKPAPRKVIKK